MKDIFKLLIFSFISAIVGFMCGIASTGHPFLGFGLCLVFTFALAYGYAISVKLYNDDIFPELFNEPFELFDEDETTTRESLGKPFTFHSEDYDENTQPAQ